MLDHVVVTTQFYKLFSFDFYIHYINFHCRNRLCLIGLCLGVYQM